MKPKRHGHTANTDKTMRASQIAIATDYDRVAVTR